MKPTTMKPVTLMHMVADSLKESNIEEIVRFKVFKGILPYGKGEEIYPFSGYPAYIFTVENFSYHLNYENTSLSVMIVTCRIKTEMVNCPQRKELDALFNAHSWVNKGPPRARQGPSGKNRAKKQ